MKLEDLKTKVREAFENSNTTLSYESSGDDLEDVFTTRENGDVGEEEFSNIDYQDAMAMQLILQEEVGQFISTDIEVVDEWVSLIVEYVRTN